MCEIEQLNFTVENTLKQLNVLYTEDEENIRINIEKTLNLICKKVYVSSDAQTAMDIYQNNNIDIILSDINLPGINGLEFTQRIREQDGLIPIILLTAYTTKDFLLTATRLKLIDYLIKPTDFDMLYSALKRATKEILGNGTYLINFFNNTYYNFNKKILIKGHLKEEIPLTSKEIELLEYLLKFRGKLVTTDELKNYLWKDSDLATDSALKNLLNKLRNKIGKETISNISGVGYRLVLQK